MVYFYETVGYFWNIPLVPFCDCGTDAFSEKSKKSSIHLAIVNSSE